MLSKHLLKVIIGFCGMIIFGLATLVIVDSLKDKDQKAQAKPALIPAVAPSPIKAPVQKIPVKKSTTSTKALPR